MVQESTLSKIADDTRFGPPVNRLEGRAATQSDPDSFEKTAGQFSHEAQLKQRKSHVWDGVT